MPDKKPRAARPTLAVVADRAGTSVPTVSKALRGGTDVAPATRERILRVASELGYSQPGDVAREDHPEPGPGVVDFVLASGESSWTNRALSGVEGAANEADLDVVITLVRRNSDWVDRVLRRESRGAILAVVDPTRDQWRRLIDSGRPVVLLDPMATPPRGVGSVGAMNWQGGRSAAEHLVALGHTRIAVIDVSDSYEYSRARFDGFRSVLAAAGLELAPANHMHVGWERDAARVAAVRMLLGPDRPTAIFACTETLALGVYDAVAELKLSIPDDVSVVGFDDLPEAGWASPPMTTVQQPIAEMAASALRMLLRIGQPGYESDGHAPREELATRLIVRGSTGRVGPAGSVAPADRTGSVAPAGS
ncbi:LacI family DNA-binding transcriptional regulator [Humibacter soli]